MNKYTVNGDIVDMELRQMNPSRITYLSSHMYLVDFELDNGIDVSYVFNITKGNKYFLQRMRPYAMVHGKYANTREIVDFIKTDLGKFKNAQRSSNFGSFVEVSCKSLKAVALLEEMFLNHNIPKEDMQEIARDLDGFMEKIQAIKERAAEIDLNGKAEQS